MGLCCLLVPDNSISSRHTSREPIWLFSGESGVTYSSPCAWDRKLGALTSQFSWQPFKNFLLKKYFIFK